MAQAWDTNENTADTTDADADPNQPEPGTDSRVEDWHGQSVDRDAELAEELVDEHGEERAEELFEEQADGQQTQQARHGDTIDPEQGESAYKDS